MSAYDFVHLGHDLVFIRWNKVASEREAAGYLADLTKSIEQAPGKIYFFSDLRYGHITSTRVLREMGRLTAHPNWGGGVALVEALTAEVFVRLFGRFVDASMTDFIFDSIETACARLERWQEGITQGYDWGSIVDNRLTKPD